MKAIISADELAKDVAGAEALLERHQEHKVSLCFLILPLISTVKKMQRYLNFNIVSGREKINNGLVIRMC